jgi:hypothetical protein
MLFIALASLDRKRSRLSTEMNLFGSHHFLVFKHSDLGSDLLQPDELCAVNSQQSKSATWNKFKAELNSADNTITCNVQKKKRNNKKVLHVKRHANEWKN